MFLIRFQECWAQNCKTTFDPIWKCRIHSHKSKSFSGRFVEQIYQHQREALSCYSAKSYFSWLEVPYWRGEYTIVFRDKKTVLLMLNPVAFAFEESPKIFAPELSNCFKWMNNQNDLDVLENFSIWIWCALCINVCR